MESSVLTPAMIPEKQWRHATREEEKVAVAEFSAMVGLGNVRKEVRRLKYLIQDGTDIRQHFLFYGNPGTGKTTVARMISQVLKETGVLKSGRVTVVKAQDLLTLYSGEAERVFKSAMGGVLFIDETYHLTPRAQAGDFSDTMMDLLLEYTDPDEKKQLCVTCADYEERMQEFLGANDGLERRFSHPIRFSNYTPEDLVQILKQQLAKTKYQGDEGFYQAALENFRANQVAIGRRYNGRYIGIYLERARAEYLERTEKQKEKNYLLTAADAPDFTPGKT